MRGKSAEQDWSCENNSDEVANISQVHEPDDSELRVQPLINSENNVGQTAEQNWSYENNSDEVIRRFGIM